MRLRKGVYILGIVLLLSLAALITMFVVKKDDKIDYKGMLVMDYNLEVSS